MSSRTPGSSLEAPTPKPRDRYLAALALAALALGVRALLGAALGPQPPFFTVYPAVMASALLLGAGPALVTLGTAAGAAVFWLLPVEGTFGLDRVADLERLLLLLATGGVMVWLARVHERRRARLAERETRAAVALAEEHGREALLAAARQAEHAQRAERERLEVTLRSIGDAVIATDAQARVTLLNPVAEVLTGWSQAEALGQPLDRVFRILDEATRQPSEDPVARVLREGTVVGLAGATLLVRRDGTELPIADSGAPIRGRDGSTEGVVLVFRDQSAERADQRVLEEALDRVEASERRYRLLADHALDVIWTLDLATGRYGYISPAITALRGLTVEEALAEPLERSLTPESLKRVQASMASLGTSEGRDRRTEVYDQPCADGSVKHVEITTSVVRDGEGRAVEVVGVSRDATARVEAERALREREGELRTILEASLDGIFILDPRAVILRVNDVFCQQTGYSREELVGMTPRELEADESGEQIEARLARMKERGWDRFETRHRRKDGSVHDVEVSIQYTPAEGGRLVGFARDISERKAAEAAVRASEYRYRAIFDQAAVGVLEADSGTGRFLRVNEKLCELLGYTREELLALRWQDVTLPGEAAADEARLAEQLAHDRSYTREKRYLRKDGSAFWGTLRVSRLQVPGTLPTSNIAVITDISERKRAEERYQALSEHSSDLTIVLDHGRRITFVSPAVRHLLGFTPDQLVGKLGPELLHPDDREVSRGRFETMLGTTEPEFFDVRLRRADGSFALLEAQARNLLADPSVRGIVINHRDVTERNRLREQFQQAQKLESVGRLAGGVAHDFNNLLTVILGCSESLQERLGPRGGEDREDVEEIRAAAERARDLTGQLLAFARKQVISPAVLDLSSVVLRQQKMLGRLLGEDVELEVKLQRLLWPVYADPSQVEQVLLNLAVNARDAMPRGGRLVIETRNVTVERALAAGPAAGDWVQLLVTDSGVGLRPEVREHLFEPFFTTKEQGKGTGLGLATVYGIVTQAGGHIEVESEPGRGTTLEVSFPRSDRAQAQAPGAPAAPPAGGAETVLVVEDDPQVRSIVFRILSSEGYQVLPVGNPRQVATLSDDELKGVRLLVTDVVMPGQDGHALARELTRRHPALKVLYLSGYTRDAIAERGVLDSGLHFLAKPFTKGSLLGKVREVLDAAS